MVAPILVTKLYTPPLPLRVVSRTRLINLLADGLSLGHKLTLISAPAGFGKSTLIQRMDRKHEQPVVLAVIG
ncbi:MAG: hypothetical protein U0X92_07200 [Anaerolineales bacterium]